MQHTAKTKTRAAWAAAILTVILATLACNTGPGMGPPPEEKTSGRFGEELRGAAEAGLEGLQQMPFLATEGGADQEAMKSLAMTKDLAALAAIKNWRNYQEGNIDDSWTPVLAVMHRASNQAHELLDPGTVTVETITAILPLSGRITFHTVRTVPAQAANTTEAAVTAAYAAEVTMGRALPATHLIIRVNPHRQSGAVNHGTHIEVGRGPDDGTMDAAVNLLAHELSHHWWRGNAPWLDEGMADLIAIITEHRRTGRSLSPNRAPCGPNRAPPQRPQARPAEGCDYATGQRLMLELLHSAGSEAFFHAANQLLDTKGRNADPIGRAELERAFNAPVQMAIIDHFLRNEGNAQIRTAASEGDVAEWPVAALELNVKSQTTRAEMPDTITLTAEMQQLPSQATAHLEYQDGMPFSEISLRGGPETGRAGTIEADLWNNALRALPEGHYTATLSTNGITAGRISFEVLQ